MDELTKTVLEIAREYRDPKNKVSRGVVLARVNQALRMTMRDDKQIRDAVKWLRANHPEGCFIVSSLDGGMFMARSAEEAREYMRPDWSRVNKIRERLQAQERLLEKNEAPTWVQETKQLEMQI